MHTAAFVRLCAAWLRITRRDRSHRHVCGAAAFWGPKWETPAVLAMKLDNDHAQKGFKRSFGDPLALPA